MIFFDVHTHKINKEKDIVSILSCPWKEDESFYSAGIHPWHIKDNYLEELTKIDSIANKPSILAIGEIGLDRVCQTDFELQKKVFIAQLAIAQKHNKSVIIHCVRAYDEILNLTKGNKVPLIMHGFNKGTELARQFTEKGFYLSFGKSLLDKKSKSIDAFEKSPLDHIFLETDDSDFTVQELYKRASEIKRIEVETLALQIEYNFNLIIS